MIEAWCVCQGFARRSFTYTLNQDGTHETH